MIRFGLIGLGNIGSVHVGNFAAGKVRGGCLTSVCSRRPPSIELPNDVCFFDDVDSMLDSGEVDAVIEAVDGHERPAQAGPSPDDGKTADGDQAGR